MYNTRVRLKGYQIAVVVNFIPPVPYIGVTISVCLSLKPSVCQSFNNSGQTSKWTAHRDNMAYVPISYQRKEVEMVVDKTRNFMDSRRYGTETCSCLIPHAACSQVLAVKTALRMDTGKKSLASTNVGLLRTKARGKAKSGRKQPRPGDIKVVIPEPIPEMDERENEEELVDIAIASKMNMYQNKYKPVILLLSTKFWRSAYIFRLQVLKTVI